MKFRQTFLLRALSVGLCLMTLSAKTSAETESTLAKANLEYNAGHFREAIELYRTAASSGETNAALFYNLGNANFRMEDFGQAILNYKRALALEPQHPEAAANLRVARDKARALELKPAWWDPYIVHATPSQYSIAAAVSFWAAAFCFAALFLRRRRSVPLVFVAFLALIAAGTSAAALYLAETGRNGRNLGIVTSKNIEARVATADNAGSVLVLPPGSEVQIVSRRGDWIYATLPNDLRGWIPAGSAEAVRML